MHEISLTALCKQVASNLNMWMNQNGCTAGVFVVNIAHLKCTYKKTGRSIPRCEIAHVMLVSCSQEGKPKIARLEEYSYAAEVLRLLK